MQKKNYSYQDVMNVLYELSTETKELKEAGKQTLASIQDLKEAGKQTLASIQDLKEFGKQTFSGIQDLKELGRQTFASIKESGKEWDKTQKYLAETQARTIQLLADNDAAMNKRMDKLNNFLTKKIKKMTQQVGGLTNNLGSIAEDLFFHSLSQCMAIGKMVFHTIDRNIYRRTNNIEDEFDIVLTNDNAIIICEVKLKFHPDDVEKVEKKIENYKILFPLQASYKIYGAVAGLTIPKDTIDRAKEMKYFVVTQESNKIKVLNEPVLL